MTETLLQEMDVQISAKLKDSGTVHLVTLHYVQAFAVTGI